MATVSSVALCDKSLWIFVFKRNAAWDATLNTKNHKGISQRLTKHSTKFKIVYSVLKFLNVSLCIVLGAFIAVLRTQFVVFNRVGFVAL